MCTKEETQAIVDAAEAKIEERQEKSHMALSKSISNFGSELIDIKKILQSNELDRNNLHNAYDNLVSGQKLILEQTTEHNHRMSKMEVWRSYMLGGLSVLTLLVVPIVIVLVLRFI